MRRRYKPFLQTNNSIKEIIITTRVTAVTPCITVTKRNHIALYVIGKDTAYKKILKRNKKSLKLSSELPIEIGLANLITNLKNDLTNIL